jgi:hypothetical protein
MILLFHPYQLHQKITDFKRQLLYIGTTYYERYLVFEHLDRFISEVQGFSISTIELGFKDEALIFILVYFDNLYKSISEVKSQLEILLGSKAILLNTDGLPEYLEIAYFHWNNDNENLSLFQKTEDGQLFLHYAPKEFDLFNPVD